MKEIQAVAYEASSDSENQKETLAGMVFEIGDMEIMEEMRPVPPFRCNQIETSKLAKEWRAWKESLECYFAAYGISDQKVMRAKLLHFGGPALQTVFRNLKDHNTVPVVALNWGFDAAIEKLDEFFEPRHMSTSERRKLRQMKQKANERFADYVIRLKQQAAECGFEKYGPEISKVLTEIYLTDAVVEGCTSNEVRRRILLKDLPFEEIEALGISQEGVDQQVEEIVSSKPSEKIYKVERFSSNTKNKLWPFRENVPKAKKRCRAETDRDKSSSDNNEDKFEDRNERDMTNAHEKVYYAFYTGNEANIIQCVVGGVKLDMLVDSGSDANLISDAAWTELKAQNVAVLSSTKGSSRILKAYGSDRPLKILGSFEAIVAVEDREVRAEFLVVEGGQRCLLGDATAKEVGVLRVGLQVNRLEETVEPFTKIRGIKAHIHMDPDAVPVFQPVRRIPAPLEEAVNRKIDQLLRRDIIELKLGPTSWVSPLVIVGKADGEPRLCLDLRRVNETVLREHHPMPVVDDYIMRLGKGRVWSKLDIREAFLQVELAGCHNIHYKLRFLPL
ncbi:uncharacterized protein LOC134210124 [Armigeres subalbatus]|uniref:uncharacterized protein LOC134210124 n=1 Tax=Armigeres subalbatus TaxID=124917 RepID=UPI002ED0BF38